MGLGVVLGLAPGVGPGSGGLPQTDVTRLALFGDSVTEANNGQNSVGYFSWANVLLDHRFEVVAFAGVGGNTTAQMLARIEADVLGHDPGVCIVLGGGNDVVGGVDAATIVSNLTTIYETLRARGISVVAGPIYPSVNYDAGAETTTWEAVNAALEAYAAAHSWLIWSDWSIANLDIEAETPAPLAGRTHDGVHPNALGAAYMGYSLKTLLASIPRFQFTRELFLRANTDAKLLKDNPFMLAGAGGRLNDVLNANVASNWHVYVNGGTGSVALVERADGYGNWQQVGISAGNFITLNFDDITTGFEVGDSIRAQLEMESDDDWSSTPRSLELYLACLNASNSVLAVTRDLYTNSTTQGDGILRVPSGTLRTLPVTIPANTAKLRFYVQLKIATGTVRFGEFEVRRV